MLTDNEIKKALEESISFDEPYESDFTLIRIEYIKNALDLISRLQAKNTELLGKIEGLEANRVELLENIEQLESVITQIKSEAYKEFAEEMKGVLPGIDDNYIESYVDGYIDDTLKKLYGNFTCIDKQN